MDGLLGFTVYKTCSQAIHSQFLPTRQVFLFTNVVNQMRLAMYVVHYSTCDLCSVCAVTVTSLCSVQLVGLTLLEGITEERWSEAI